MSITITDMFCGAGGSSTGLLEIPGVTVKTAMNHWERAIETHSLNHPGTDHVLADIQVTDPRYIASSDILWASPECTNHSVAKGKRRITNQPDIFGDSIADEAAEKSRATMWDVPRFAEQHKYKIIITENVVDAAKWIMFDAWLMAMASLGYEHHIVYLNSMHAQLGGMPAPQSRDRMYVMFWLKGSRKPDFDRLRPMAYCPTCDETVRALQVFKKPNERWGRYRAQYNYRCPNAKCRNEIIEPAWLPASSAIDWSIRGQKIGERPRPLAEKTMARIKIGLEKYGAQRMALDAVRSAPIISAVDRQPFATQTTSYTRSLLTPPGEHMMMEYYGNGVTHPVSKAIPTITTTDRFAMITTLRGTAPAQVANSTKLTSEPFGTITAGGTHHGLAEWTAADINECEFRMIAPHEYMAGMAFPKDYIMTGNNREKVKQSGNSVTPPVSRDLGMIAVESLIAA